MTLMLTAAGDMITQGRASGVAGRSAPADGPAAAFCLWALADAGRPKTHPPTPAHQDLRGEPCTAHALGDGGLVAP